MSKSVRVALVIEGPTDKIAIEHALKAISKNVVDFQYTVIQPEQKTADAFGGPSDASEPVYQKPGWGGVCSWCQSMSAKALAINATDKDVFHIAELQHDILILHLDADVATFRYEDASLTSNANAPLPINDGTTLVEKAHILEDYLCTWLAPIETNDNVVFCIPSMAIETWMCVGLNHKTSYTTKTQNVEERNDLIGRIPKRTTFYNKNAQKLTKNWEHVESSCSQAKRFGDAMRSCSVL